MEPFDPAAYELFDALMWIDLNEAIFDTDMSEFRSEVELAAW